MAQPYLSLLFDGNAEGILELVDHARNNGAGKLSEIRDDEQEARFLMAHQSARDILDRSNPY